MRIFQESLLISLLTLASATAGMAQPVTDQGAANAISEAVKGGTSPYRPPSAEAANPEDALRARCEDLKAQFNATSRQPSYQSPGPATQTAQGRTIPKIERDQTRDTLQETYRAVCTQ